MGMSSEDRIKAIEQEYAEEYARRRRSKQMTLLVAGCSPLVLFALLVLAIILANNMAK